MVKQTFLGSDQREKMDANASRPFFSPDDRTHISIKPNHSIDIKKEFVLFKTNDKENNSNPREDNYHNYSTVGNDDK